MKIQAEHALGENQAEHDCEWSFQHSCPPFEPLTEPAVFETTKLPRGMAATWLLTLQLPGSGRL